jgi:hypothetical protein
MRGIKLTVALAIVAAAVASTASADQGRRLTGPFCVGKTNAGKNAGIVRSVAVNRPCRTYEIRKHGVAVPHPERGATSQAGPKGDPGAAGSNGAAGAPGPKGDSGSVTVTQLTGDQANCVKITGSDGSSGIICGTAGTPGAKGDKGDKGDPAICPIKPPKCNSGKGNGPEGNPDCDPGNSSGHNSGGD